MVEKLFKNIKQTSVQYGIYTDLKAPNSIYPNIELLNNHSELKCPAVNSISNKIFGVNSFLKAKIEVHYVEDAESLRFRYDFDDSYHPANSTMHQFIKDLIILNTDNGNHTIQILSPYVFLTNDKNLEINTIQPDTKVENLEYVMGGFKPYGWARPLNAAYKLIDNNKIGVIHLDVNTIMMKYMFNKPIKLQYVDFNTKQLNFINSCKGAIKYRKNINKLYNTHINRRKKNILQ